MAVYFVDLKELGALAADYRMFWTDLDPSRHFPKVDEQDNKNRPLGSRQRY